MPILNSIGGGSIRGYGRKGYKPKAPTIGTATANGSTAANVTFTAPLDNGGAAITKYTAISTPGSVLGTLSQAGSGTIQVSGLTSCTAYTFKVYATNKYGDGTQSAASNSVTPAVPAPTSVQFFMYAGGGNGGTWWGGGGGGGAGTRYSQGISSGTTYNIAVGAGGGGSSSFGCYTATGGGNGSGMYDTGGTFGDGGASGSGGPFSNGYGAGGYGGQSHSGGSWGGGGGGAGGPPGNGCGVQSNKGGCGGYSAGLNCSAAVWGGGGGGSWSGLLGVPNNGGYAGGGSGGGYAWYCYNPCYDPSGFPGNAGGGGGGGGGSNFGPVGYGGAGGAGYVIIWHSTAYKTATITGGSTGISGGNRYYEFTGAGTLRW